MKISTIIAASVSALALVQPSQARAESQEFIEALFAAFNSHNVEKLKTFYADDAVVHSPESCEPTVGRDAISEGYAAMFQQIPDVHDALELVVTEGERTAVIFTASSRIPGAEFELPISAFLTIKDGKITEDRVFFNSDMELNCN
ncbi:MAG: nuclear transport factor 2 family protein [Pseudomonadota bacterium]